MKTVEKRTVEVEDVIYRCDFCDTTIRCNHGMRGRPMLTCTVCRKHACVNHRTEFNEDGGDYADATVCPACLPRFQAAWDWAIANADRYADLMDVVRRHDPELFLSENSK